MPLIRMSCHVGIHTFAKLPIFLLAFFMIVGNWTTPVARRVGVLIYASAFFFGAFSQPLRGYNWKQAMMLGLTITLSAQVLSVLVLLVSHLVQDAGVDEFGVTLLFRLVILVANAIIGSILGLVGWTLGRYLPEAAA